MGVSVFVMPLGTNLRGNFRAPGMARRRRSEEDVRAALDAFRSRLETLGVVPDWDEEGPVRSATMFSVDAFSLPFLRARSWSTRVSLPRLCALDLPQIWIPSDFEPVFQVDAPWSPGTEVSVASAVRLRQDLDRLLAEMAGAEGADLGETCQVAARLGQIAGLGVEHRAPVVIEG